MLVDYFGNKDYDATEVNEWSKAVSILLKDRVKGVSVFTGNELIPDALVLMKRGEKSNPDVCFVFRMGQRSGFF